MILNPFFICTWGLWSLTLDPEVNPMLRLWVLPASR